MVKQQSLKESSFVKSERAQIKSKTYEIKLAYLSSRMFSRSLTPQFKFFSTSFLFLLSPRQELSIVKMEEMRIKTLQLPSDSQSDGLRGVRNRANQPWMKTCRTAHTWKNMIRGSWLDVSLFSHVGKAICDIWLVYIGLRTKIYSAAFQCVNLSMYIIITDLKELN